MLDAVIILLVIAAIALGVGLVFGRVVAAPVIQRVADRAHVDEEPSDGPG